MNALIRNAPAVEEDAIHIHLLRINTESEIDSNQNLISCLSVDEQAFCSRLQSPEKRGEYLASRLFVRWLGSAYLKQEMPEISLGRGEWGKPFFTDSRIQFNLSHTQGLMACSFSRIPVGIDVETLNLNLANQRDWRILVERYFTAGEKSYISSQKEDSQCQAFLRVFTLKEAYVKALGRGFNIPLSSFEVPLPVRERSRLGSIDFFSPSIGKPYCLAHAADNPGGLNYRYEVYDWNEKSVFHDILIGSKAKSLNFRRKDSYVHHHR